MDRPIPAPTGNCFENSLHYIAYLPLKERLGATLCHAMVIGQKDIAGVCYAHAWVEIRNGTIVVDVTMDVKAPKHFTREAYYAAGQIKEVKRYTRKEAAIEALHSGTSGPWHPMPEPYRIK